ncbi:MAG: adenylate/guanylate cyclase domain-containing protein [Acidimicrobiia bacterium]
MEPETRYARLDGDRIAYQVVGDGPTDLVASLGTFASLDGLWALPEAVAPYVRLSTRCRLILFDRLGSGWSDAVPLDALPPLESRWNEIQAVMDDAESERAVILGKQDGGPPAMFGAVTSPDRVSGLILFNSPARYSWASDYPMGIPADQSSQWREMMSDWDIDKMMQLSFPSKAGDERVMQWGRRNVRAMATPSAMLAYVEEIYRSDVRELLPLVHVPTLVIRRRDHGWTKPEMERYVADHIAGARFVEVPGADAEIYFEHSNEIVEAITDFLHEIQPGPGKPIDGERLMATVLFTDIVSSTERALATGDSAWVQLLQLHDEVSKDVVKGHGGGVVKDTGDGILAMFDGPGRGLRAAADLEHALEGIGLPIRAGLHTGEVEMRGEDIAGIGVHIASRVMAEAGPGEILVSRTVRDLVVGSTFQFEDRGPRHLKGVEGEWDLLALSAW